MAGAVGLIGIGLMGSALAGRLLGAGFEVVGYDIDAARRGRLADLGGRPVESVAEVAFAAEHVMIAVLTVQQVEDVIGGAGGLAAAARHPLTAICTATCDPERIRALAQRLEGGPVSFVDAPVSGSSAQVAAGEGLGLIGGDEGPVAAASAVLDAVYPRRVFIGPAGDATKAKLAINLALGLNRLALAEALVFSERIGLDPAQFLSTARLSAAYSQIMDAKGDKMVNGDFTPQGRVAQSRKDFGIILAEAHRVGQTLPLSEVLLDVLDRCMEQGEGDLDNIAVIREIRRRHA